MITREERYAIAAKLRKINPDVFSSYDSEDYLEALEEATGYPVGLDFDLANHLADLIHPESERTCKPDFRNNYYAPCNHCGYVVYLGMNYCPGCGEKVD